MSDYGVEKNLENSSPHRGTAHWKHEQYLREEEIESSGQVEPIRKSLLSAWTLVPERISSITLRKILCFLSFCTCAYKMKIILTL